MAAYDAVVVGLGAMGSAVADALSGRGVRVLGLDRFVPPHLVGSSHGRTRITRQAYFEHPLYVPLVRRASELWAELQGETGRCLFRETGALAVGPALGTLVGGTRHSAEAHGIPCESVDGDEIRRRWPALRPPGDAVGLYESHAGVLFPERCVEALLQRSRARGADFLFEGEVTGWAADDRGVTVRTAAATHHAAALVLSAGPWIASLLAGLAVPVSVERQLAHWFAPAGDPQTVGAEHLPVVLWEDEPERLFYVVPDLGDGLKAALHHGGEEAAPDRVRPPDAADEAAVRGRLVRLLPAANGPLREARTCLYTNTPDGHFLIDRHPSHRQVVIVSPCSGHGFKFATAVGEAVAELLTSGTSRFDLTPFALRRLLPTA